MYITVSEPTVCPKFVIIFEIYYCDCPFHTFSSRLVEKTITLFASTCRYVPMCLNDNSPLNFFLCFFASQLTEMEILFSLFLLYPWLKFPFDEYVTRKKISEFTISKFRCIHFWNRNWYTYILFPGSSTSIEEKISVISMYWFVIYIAAFRIWITETAVM